MLTVLIFSSCLLVGIQLFGGLLGQIAAAVGSVLVIFLAFSANARYLGALLLLCLPSYGIKSFGEGTYPLYFTELVINTPFLGFDWSAGLALMVGAFARILVEFAVRASTFSFGANKLWLIGFLLAVLIALYSAVLGYIDGYSRVTSGVRGILALGGYFWALILVKRTNWEVTDFTHQLNILVITGAFLVSVGFLRGHINFLLFGLFGGLLIYWFTRKNWIFGALGLIGISFGLFATLTTAAIPIVALLISLITFQKWSLIRRLSLRLFIVGLTAVSLSAVAIGSIITLKANSGFVSKESEYNLVSFAAFKLFADRGPLWVGAKDLIFAGPYVFVPSGRSILPAQEFLYAGLHDWRNGAHNALLELLVNVGVVAGFWGIFFTAFVIWKLTSVASRSRNGVLRGVASGVIGTVIVGVTTGNFPVQDVGFLIWALAGWAVAVLLFENKKTPSAYTAK